MVMVILLGFKGDGVASSKTSFGLEMVPNTTQDGDVTGHFSFKVEGTTFTETLQVKLKNYTDENIVVESRVVNALTSSSGSTYYTDEEREVEKITNDDYYMDKYLDGNKEIELKPKEEKVVSFKLDIPKGEGKVLGGLQFSEKVEEEVEEDKSDKSEGFTILSKIEMLVGVIVDFGSDKDVEFEVGDNVFVKSLPAYYVIKLPIEQKSPYLKLLALEYEVKEKNGDILFEGEMEGQVAPYNYTELDLPWKAEDIKKNHTYVLTGKGTYNDKDGKEDAFTFEREFKLKDEPKDKRTTSLAVPKVVDSINWVYVLLGTVIVLLLLVIFRKTKKDGKGGVDEGDMKE